MVALISVGIGLVFSVLFHFFVREKPDDFIKKCVALLNNSERKNSVRAFRNRREGESFDDGDEDEAALLGDESSRSESPEVLVPRESSLSTRWLSLGKQSMTVREWLCLPQLYIVALIYMATRLSVNVTQVYVPLYLQKTLKLPPGSVATIPLTMYTFGLIITIFIKLINKYCGRQISYIFGATLTIIGAVCVLLVDLHYTSGINQYRVYGVAALMGKLSRFHAISFHVFNFDIKSHEVARYTVYIRSFAG